MKNIKSITAVITNRGWAVQQLNDDGTELFVIPEIYEPAYSKEHAELAAKSLLHHLECGGGSYAKPLPAGVDVLNA